MTRDLGNQADVVIIGGGLVGSLLSTFLARRGKTVHVFERKPDLRRTVLAAGRSLNLTLCTRGFAALDRVGAGDAVRAVAIPAYSRAIHDEAGGIFYQPYGNRGEALYSVTRNDLNRVLLDHAEKEPGVKLHFEYKCREIDFQGPSVVLEHAHDRQVYTVKAGMLFGADGAYSTVRQQMERRKADRFNFSQEYIQQGYKELSIPADVAAEWGFDNRALHIWPRGKFMLIGFSNHDGTATLALHLPYEGEPSFASIQTEQDLLSFVSRYFPDTVGRIPNLLGDFFGRPVSSMLTIRCFPWIRGRIALLGDAAHAMVPSYGQGANAGFEDCAVLDTCLEQSNGDWDAALAAFQLERKPNADAIADLSLHHFSEIRDRLAEARFQLRKTVERKLDELFPGCYLSLHAMVSFTTMPYVQAIRAAEQQEKLVDSILESEGIEALLAAGAADEVIREQVRLERAAK